ncbi:rhodanese-like domain-containing protein [Leeuwenhoekiella sp. NPDC079379]|uniref:rhodanese-like domain-containing protein n=1 Tax=Leeuwenhoekiella sp. NPDC079379 TaxID=3364122 RepID=UPI0037C56CF4
MFFYVSFKKIVSYTLPKLRMPQLKISLFLLLFPILSFGQNKSIDKLLQTYNSRSVPYISVQELKMKSDTYIIIDTRKKEEFEVSHIPNSIWVGEKPERNLLKSYLNLKKTIVVYCTVGIRSEDYGEKLNKEFQGQIYNLYGGIFAWKDAGYALRDSKNKSTIRVHTFSKNWEDYLKTGIAVH